VQARRGERDAARLHDHAVAGPAVRETVRHRPGLLESEAGHRLGGAADAAHGA
jgi:hypothetical protein